MTADPGILRRLVMTVRRLPVHPNPDQLRHQAKDLLRTMPPGTILADAQRELARSYQTSSWTRLIHAARLADAIWRDDLDSVRDLVTGNPNLLHEHVLIRTDSNWGPPMSYAANLGRDRIIRFLHERGAKDHRHAWG